MCLKGSPCFSPHPVALFPSATAGQVKFTGPPLSRDAFDRSYEASEVKVLKDSRIVITTCTTVPWAYNSLQDSMMKGLSPWISPWVEFGGWSWNLRLVERGRFALGEVFCIFGTLNRTPGSQACGTHTVRRS